MRCVVDKVAMGQVFLWVLKFSPASFIPPMLHTHLHLHVAIKRWTCELNLGTLRKQLSFKNWEALA